MKRLEGLTVAAGAGEEFSTSILRGGESVGKLVAYINAFMRIWVYAPIFLVGEPDRNFVLHSSEQK